MVNVTAKMVQSLRKTTGAGMMDCKMALVAAKGDMDEAKDWLRKKGVATADKKSDRDAEQGLVGIRLDQDAAYIAMMNCETDFVARTKRFQDHVLDFVSRMGTDRAQTTDEVTSIIAELGENIKIGSTDYIKQENVLSGYVHNKVADNLGTIGVILSMRCEPTEEMAKLAYSIAMHIAAMDPQAIDVGDLDSEFVEKERKIMVEQALESGKPENIVEKMVEGRMKKRLSEVTLVNQPFVMDKNQTVGDLLKEANASVVKFVRMAIGE